MKLINIGFGNMVCANRLVAIVSPESAPIKRIIQDARERGSLVDATYGRRTRAVIITDSDHVILSAVQPETVANRLVDEAEAGGTGQYEQLELFTDYGALEKEKENQEAKLAKERKLQEAVLSVKKKYGKNAILKGMNLQEGATTMERNRQIGGHKA